MQRNRPRSPVPSHVSMKSDRSKHEPPNFSEAGSTPGERPRSPVPSCVSMKSDRSKHEPPNFSEGGIPAGERPRSPVPSHVSMKSDRSKHEPPNFREGGIPAAERPRSPVPSHVSMKSDRSKHEPPNFSEGGIPAADRPRSPVPSHVSMKSDRSKHEPPNFSEGGIPAGERPHSPVPSHVSMKSDRSKHEPPNFSEGGIPAAESHVSMKSDRSKHEPPNFSEGGIPAAERPRSPVPSHVSMKTDRSKHEPPNFSEGGIPAGESCVAVRSEQCHDEAHNTNKGEVATEERYEHTQPETYKHHLLKKCEFVIEGIPIRGKPTAFNDIYTELFLTEGDVGQVNEEHEVRQIERTTWRETEMDQPIKFHELFQPSPGQDQPIKAVLTTGVAGIGKTISVQKFLLDWLEGLANQNVRYIFPLPFRELNLMRKMTLSLVELVQHFFRDIKDIGAFACRILFIFDGLDECRLPLDFKSSQTCYDVSERVSVDVLLINLIRGNLLPSAHIWITTRPAAANQIPPECVTRVTEIRGFTDPQKEEYFMKRLEDEDLAKRTIRHLKSSRSLFIMCHIPVFCWISATVIKRSSETGSGEMPRTLTQMYTHFLLIQTHIKREKYTEMTEEDEEMIFKLAKLACHQLERGNLIFYEEDLMECGIDVTEACVYSGVFTQIFREEAWQHQGKVFSFVHLSIQEFLAALYVFLCFSKQERQVADEFRTSEFFTLLSAATLGDLHKRAVDLAVQTRKGELDLFLRFLLGLSLKANQNLIKYLMTQSSSQSQSSEQTSDQSDIIKRTVRFIKCKIIKHRATDKSYNRLILGDHSDRAINLFYCMNELNYHAVLEKIDSISGRLDVTVLLPGEWRTVKFKSFLSENQMKEFNLEKLIKTPEMDRNELITLDKVLERVLPVCTSASLEGCKLTWESCPYLASVLKCPTSSLTSLDLQHNRGLEDEGVKLLCSGLEDPNCILKTLRLEACNLKSASCSYLVTVLESPTSSLTSLDLSWNDIQDCGVELLSAGLNVPNCSLRQLRLGVCNLKAGSCVHLATVFRSPSSSLTTLVLNNNDLLDQGVEQLCSGLADCNCKLKELQLSSCKLTAKSCSFLAAALKSPSSSLTSLDLDKNVLEDPAIQLLSAGLEDPNCKLETLRLRSCKVTPESCFYLASVMTSSSSSLTALDLSGNTAIEDLGVEILCSGLQHPNCNLKELILVDCNLSSEGCQCLATTLTSPSSRLTFLDLRHNDRIDESGGEQLTILEKDPHCKLEKVMWKKRARAMVWPE